MVQRTGLKAASFATALFFVAAWLGFVISRPREPNLGVDPKDAFVVLEETTFVVPEGTMAVFTALGSRLGTITPIGIEADGSEVAQAWGADVADQAQPIFALAQSGQRIEIVGGLVQGDDAFALGYLRPQPGSAGDSAIPPAGLNRTGSN